LEEDYKEDCITLKSAHADMKVVEEDISEHRSELAEVVRLCKTWTRSDARKMHATYERETGGIFGSILYPNEEPV